MRCSWFMQNFSESYFLDPLLAGELALPVDRVAEPFVDAEDIAEVAVAALNASLTDGVKRALGREPRDFADYAGEAAARGSGRARRRQLPRTTMDELPLVTLTTVAALGCGLVAGVFFAFSGFVMKALARLQPTDGLAAMQAINVAAVSRAFMLALFGTAALCVALAGWALAALHEPFAAYLLAGSALYLVGVIALTIAYHVPRNEALARVDPTAADAAAHWSRYAIDWTRWNHLRAAAALAAAGLFTIALYTG